MDEFIVAGVTARYLIYLFLHSSEHIFIASQMIFCH